MPDSPTPPSDPNYGRYANTIDARIRNYFAPPPDLTLKALVPNNFYRRSEATLTLSFVRYLVGTTKHLRAIRAPIRGVFRLQPVVSFEDIRSTRRLMEVALYRLSIRWFWGLTLTNFCRTTSASPKAQCPRCRL